MSIQPLHVHAHNWFDDSRYELIDLFLICMARLTKFGMLLLVCIYTSGKETCADYLSPLVSQLAAAAQQPQC